MPHAIVIQSLTYPLIFFRTDILWCSFEGLPADGLIVGWKMKAETFEERCRVLRLSNCTFDLLNTAMPVKVQPITKIPTFALPYYWLGKNTHVI